MLSAFFKPKSVAVIGASRNPEKIGHVIFKNFLSQFKGKVYPVNPNADEILGHRCYHSVLNVRDKVDLAIVCVRPEFANKVVEDCVKKGVKGIVMITSGYREIGKEGVKREEELRKILKKGKTRIIGPNCIGIYDSRSGVDTLFIPTYKMKKPDEGSIAFVSQSGAFGLALLDWMAEEGIGLSKFVSYGNAVDVDETGSLEFLSKDNETKVIAMYLEGVKDGQRFMKTLKRVCKRKPVVIYKAGKEEEGKKAAISHTGSLAGSYEVFKGVIKQAGAYEAESVVELFDFSRALASGKKSKGNNVAIVTNGGGFGVIAADLCKKEGINLASFKDVTIKKIRNVLPEYARVRNPLDLIGDASAERYAHALKALMNDSNVDALLVITLMQTVSLSAEIVNVLSEINAETKKPMVVCASGGSYTKLLINALEKEGIPAYPTPERAIKALKILLA
jgi:acetyl coenzyme A synthetase (ADP forming)-like protein